MPSLNDFFNELVEVNNRLAAVHSDLVALTAETTAVRDAVDNGLGQIDSTLIAGFTTLSQGTQALITMHDYTNQVLAHHARQHDTMICSLEQISKNTCTLVNEATVQTELQSEIQADVHASIEIAKTAHPDAALELARQEQLRRQIEECCPPTEAPPGCTFEPCDAPGPIGEPPRVDFKSFERPRRRSR